MTGEMHREKPLRLALIGMSGAGKTFWTKKLTAAGYPGVSCDDRIEQKLAPRLAAGGHTYHGKRHLHRQQSADALAAPNDDRASRGFHGGAATADRKIFERSKAGFVARCVSAKSRRKTTRYSGAMLSGTDCRPASELCSARALHTASRRFARSSVRRPCVLENDSRQDGKRAMSAIH